MRHLRLLPPPEEALADEPALNPVPELAERMHAARKDGSVEAALAMWGNRVRASRGSDVAWRTTRPMWRCQGRLYNWASPVWLPTAEAERKKPVEPLRLSSLFDRAA